MFLNCDNSIRYGVSAEIQISFENIRLTKSQQLFKNKIGKSYQLSLDVDLQNSKRASSRLWLFGMLFGTGSHMLTSLLGEQDLFRDMGCSNRHSDTPENPEVAAFYVDDIMKCLLSDSRFRANVRLQARIMLQPTFQDV